MERDPQPARARIALAVAAALVLGGLVVAIGLARGGDDDAPVSGPYPFCIRSWNSDPAATAYGRHNFNSHRYEGALVTFLDLAANELAGGEGGHCAVVFPSRALDAEPFAAGQVLIGSRWQPISLLEGVSTVRVAELQARAADAGVNSSLAASGRLVGLDE
jgi:hypothetical protein